MDSWKYRCRAWRDLASGPLQRACLVEQNREEMPLGEILSSDLVRK
jgi:hypothetical protein